MTMPLRPGMAVDLLVNQGRRHATVLAVRGDQSLLEYEMPNGTTALRLQTIDPATGDLVKERGIPYGEVSLAWLNAIEAAGQEWTGRPQQSGGRVVKSVTDTITERIQERGL